MDKLPEGAVAKNGFMESFYAETPEGVAYHINGQSNVVLDASRSTVPLDVIGFDVDAIGMYGWIEFNNGIKASEIWLSLEQRGRIDEGGSDADMQTIAVQFDKSTWRVTVDRTKGFCPVKTSFVEVVDGVEYESQSSETSWQNIEGVWVPHKTRLRISPRGAANNGVTSSGEVREIALWFDWNSVNEGVDDSNFSYRDFPESGRLGVLDRTLPGQKLVQMPEGSVAESDDIALTDESVDVRRYVFLAINAAFAACLVVWLFYRRALRS